MKPNRSFHLANVYYDPCKPKEADLWFIVGLNDWHGKEYFGDYQTKAQAKRAASKIIVAYPHLRNFGITVKTKWLIRDAVSLVTTKLKIAPFY